jgi:hypothetical protein
MKFLNPKDKKDIKTDIMNILNSFNNTIYNYLRGSIDEKEELHNILYELNLELDNIKLITYKDNDFIKIHRIIKNVMLTDNNDEIKYNWILSKKYGIGIKISEIGVEKVIYNINKINEFYV